MKIGILGPGRIGSALARLWIAAGHEVCLGYARDDQKLQVVVTALGPQAHGGSPAEVATFGDAVLLAVPWAAVPAALAATGPLTDQVVIDCTTPLLPDLSGLAVGFTTSGSETIAAQVPGAKVVKAFNTLFTAVLEAPTSQIANEVVTMPYCGDDAAAKATVAQLISAIGCAPLDLGPLAMARYEEPFAMLTMHLAFAQGHGPFVGFKFLHTTLEQTDGK